MATTNPTVTTYEDLKKKIINGYYNPSENLPEVDLANQYGVSRSTVKKALLMLERENLVTIEPNKGAKVRSYSISEVKEFLELRAVLEGFIARITVPVISLQDISRMEQILHIMSERREAKDLLGYSAQNRLFHEVIYDACPNRTAVEMAISLKTQMIKYNSKTILVPGRDAQSFAEHAAILDSIKNHNCELTEVLMRTHINNVRKTFEDNFSLLF